MSSKYVIQSYFSAFRLKFSRLSFSPKSVLWLITCLLTTLGTAKKQVECTCCSGVPSEMEADILFTSEEC